ncbi:hypothetical protein LSH36_193g09014 [Paralvinella palmiformis]|uniref:Uncharacterized protein n=1 Tax=Paralvinella palmiformis TaxID=53620 RepID=A0AAD9JR07_9ANNE|nr:hypothetical protein LSH36_193g09014 [Paralvinella palmiformis]
MAIERFRLEDNMTSLLRKVIIITGASSGLGAASAVALAKYSPRLVLHGRNEKALSDVKQKCLDHGLRADDVATVTGDITEEKTIRKIVQTAKDVFGTLHVVFNNAGYLHPEDGPIHMGGTVKALDDLYSIYVRAPYLLVQESVPELMKNKGLGMKGIRVNSINPGFVRTGILDRRFTEEVGHLMMDMVEKGSPFQQKLATTDQIARIVVFLASDQSAAVHGHNLTCDLAATLTNPIVEFTKF